MLHEIILTLSGHPGALFHFMKETLGTEPDEINEPSKRIHARVAPQHRAVFHPGEVTALERLTRLGALFHELQELVESLPQGLYFQKLKSELESYFEEYEDVVVEVEKIVLSTSSPLMHTTLAQLETHFAPVLLPSYFC